MSNEEQAVLALLWPERESWRPRTRADCRHVQRPCPYVGCRHHLYLDTKPSGEITAWFGHAEPWNLTHSCSLDVAEAGGLSLEQVGGVIGVTRERVRQIEDAAFAQLREYIPDLQADDLAELFRSPASTWDDMLVG